MPSDATDLDACESRLVRRLGRLFRIERAGRFDERSPLTVQRMIKRRDAVIDELLALDADRRDAIGAPSADLVRALTDLSLEVQQSREPAAARLRRLEAEIRRRATEAPAIGLRKNPGGRLLGSG